MATVRHLQRNGTSLNSPRVSITDTAVDKMTPHQCWNVCDWETAERDQPSKAQLSPPTCTQRMSGKTIRPTVDLTHSTGGAHPPVNLLNHFSQRGDEGKDGTPSFQRHTMFKLYQLFEGNRPADTGQKARRSRSFLLQNGWRDSVHGPFEHPAHWRTGLCFHASSALVSVQ